MKKTMRIFSIALSLILALSLLPSAALAEGDGADAVMSTQAITVNGVKNELTAYNIDGCNYVKLRDIAQLLRSTDSRFSVTYDGETNSIYAERGSDYVSNGTELSSNVDLSFSCVKSGATLYVNNIRISTDIYNIGGSNYYKLRALGTALGFEVSYDEASGTAAISTTAPERDTATWEEVKASTIPACIGGPNLDDGDYVSIRWLGNSCWEINYRGQIILVDNFYDRGERAPDTGINASDIKYADLIIITHGHKDHISDTAQVALQTGAPIYGHETVITELLSQNVPESQLTAYSDPEIADIDFPLDGVSITMIHNLHNFGGKDSSGFIPAINAYTTPTDEILSEEAEIEGRGSGDFSIMDEGLYAFLFTFDSGFTFMGMESNARGYSEGMQQFLEELGQSIDVYAAPMQLGYDPISDIYDKKVVEIVEKLQPGLVLPQHHDVYPDFPMTSVLPMAQYIYDNMSDTTKFYLQMYREPLIFNTVTQHASGALSPLS